MKSFIYNQVKYRSLRECCHALNISYSKAKRLTRHYIRASENPVLVIDWIIKDNVPTNEMKSSKYQHDLVMGLDRHYRFLERQHRNVLEYFLGDDL